MELQYFIYPYRYDCDNAIMLRNRLNGQRIKLEGSTYKQKANHVIINWGNSKCPYSGPRVINQPRDVDLAVDKLSCFDQLHGANLPVIPITRSRKLAKLWLEKDEIVFGRTLTRSNNGKGIYRLEKGKEPQEGTKFYTRYIPQKEEYRVNVFMDKTISVRRKVLEDGHEPSLIRSGVNGYVFADPKNNYPPVIEQLAKDAVSACNLMFGGVDIIQDKKDNVYVVEVNTAPELQGKAMDKLAAYIKEFSESAYNV